MTTPSGLPTKGSPYEPKRTPRPPKWEIIPDKNRGPYEPPRLRRVPRRPHEHF